MYRVGRVRLYLTIVAILLIESTFLNMASIGGIRPDILLIFVIFVGFYSDRKEALEASIAGGLLKGVMSVGSIAPSIVLLGFGGLVSNYCKNKIFKDHFLIQAAFLFLIAVSINAVQALLKIALENVEPAGATIYNGFMPALLAMSIYTALAAPPVFFLLKKMLKVKE